MNLIVVLIRRIAIGLSLLCVGASASAYTASSTSEGPAGTRYQWSLLIGGPYGAPNYISGTAACGGEGAQARCASAYPGKTCSNYRTISSYQCMMTVSGGVGDVGVGYYQTIASSCSTGYTNVGGSCLQYSCPGGGTLSGSICTCAAGESDTGSACAACPTGQYKRTAGGACEAKCPEGQANGPASYPPSGAAGFCMDKQEFAVGVGWVDGATTTTVPRCKYGGTGISVCADTGSGVSCYSETTYGLGSECPTETTIPDTPQTCDTGDMYCETSGACGTGYVAGTFNGKNLCVKTGETVTVTPRTSSALDPPKAVAPPATLPGGSSGGTVTTDPTSDTVIAIGPGASTVGGVGGSTGTGGGSGGGGTGEDIECGLPGMPKCQIDETGTPTGAGAFTDALSSLESAKGEAVTGLSTVTNPTGKNTSWTFSLSLPTSCSPMSVNMIYETVTLDPCEYIDVMHDLMSMIWAASTLFLVLGMVGRTLREA